MTEVSELFVVRFNSIDPISIVHMDKLWDEIAKKLKCRRPGEGVGQ